MFGFTNISPIIFYISFVVSKQVNNLPLITGGYRPKTHVQAKYIVSVRIFRPLYSVGDNHVCAGAIISTTKILTAAHCFKTTEFRFPAEVVTVIAGNTHRLKSSNTTQQFEVLSILIHPEYKEDPVIADVAILKLSKSLLIDGITTAILQLTRDRPPVDTKCTILGWGRVIENGPIPDEVIYLDLYIMNSRWCTFISPDMVPCVFCADDLSDISKSTCTGDSGAPLICNDRLAGVLSYGMSCGYEPKAADFYIDISCYRSWIIENNVTHLKASFKFIKLISLLLLKYYIFL